MSGAEDAFAASERLLVEFDGAGEVAGGLVGVGEVVAAGERVGVVGAEDAFAVGERLLVEGDGAFRGRRRPGRRRRGCCGW
jgi:hypothetical protein